MCVRWCVCVCVCLCMCVCLRETDRQTETVLEFEDPVNRTGSPQEHRHYIRSNTRLHKISRSELASA